MAESLKVLVAAVGWTGHVYPALALARELDRRGHDVVIESVERWRGVAERIGARFAPAHERISFAGLGDADGAPSLAQAARELGPLIDDFRPDVVVSDMWTLAPVLAAEVAGVARATLIPHPYPVHEPGVPFYPLGLAPPRTALGRAAWRAMWPAVGTRLPNTRLRRIRSHLDATRRELGLGPVRGYDGQISDRLALVATFPQLEYPRRWPAHVHVTGPMAFEIEHPEIELPPGEAPLVIVASSTERDPEHELARATLAALEGAAVRVAVTLNRRGATLPEPAPANAVVVDWASYSQLMPAAAAVVCHGGHGTVTRAVAAGAPVLVCPRAGEMAENGARVTWAGAGLMVPQRLLGPRAVRLAIERLLGERRFGDEARAIAAWARDNDGAARGADLVESGARA